MKSGCFPKMGQQMKYEVKVGQPVEGQVTVTVVQKEEFSFKKAATYVVIALIAGVVSTSVAYGMATGDYTVAKSIAETGKDALDFLVQLGMKNMK